MRRWLTVTGVLAVISLVLASASAAFKSWEHRDRMFWCHNTAGAGLWCGLNVDTFRDADLDYLINIRRDTAAVTGDATFVTGGFLRQHPKTQHGVWPKPRGWSHTESGVHCQGGRQRGGAIAVLCGRADG